MENFYRHSYLKGLFGQSLYYILSDLKPIALVYAIVLLLFVALSFFFQSSFIEFFINHLMGWTILSIPFVGIIIVTLDKEIKMDEDDYYRLKRKEGKKPRAYVFSTIWGIILCVLGIIGLHYSGKYKDYYSFQCSSFYVDQTNGTYHLWRDCRGAEIANEDLIEMKGKELHKKGYRLCETCHDRIEDAKFDAYGSNL